MKILVTGGAGFIGTWLVPALLNDGHYVTVLDNLSPQIHGHIPFYNPTWIRHHKVRFIRDDIRSPDALNSALQDSDMVVHLAAETGTGQSMYRIRHYSEVNQQATATLFDIICSNHKTIKRVVLASSRSIYGEGAYSDAGQIFIPSPRVVDDLEKGIFEVTTPSGQAATLIATPEDARPSPASIYAATKLSNEVLGKIVAEAYGITVVALRFQNVYGEGQSLNNPYTGLLSIFSNRMRRNQHINIFEDGNESRDFVHVEDAVQGLKLALHKELSGFNAINIGSGVASSVKSVAEKLKGILKSNSELVVSGEFRAGDIRHCYADLTKAKEKLGFQPQISLEIGLERFCQWVLTQDVADDRSDEALMELKQVGLSR